MLRILSIQVLLLVATVGFYSAAIQFAMRSNAGKVLEFLSSVLNPLLLVFTVCLVFCYQSYCRKVLEFLLSVLNPLLLVFTILSCVVWAT